MRATAASLMAFALIAAALPAACSYHVDDYKVAPTPAPTCDGGCASCSAVTSKQADQACVCGASDAGACDGGSSATLLAALASCAQQRCVLECAALASGSTSASAASDCSACTQSKCANETMACNTDVGCPH